MQRHHLLPRQLLLARCFRPLFDPIGQDRLGFQDFRLALLQRALRRRLLADGRELLLNRADPLGARRDVAELDAMAELPWRETEAAKS